MFIDGVQRCSICGYVDDGMPPQEQKGRDPNKTLYTVLFLAVGLPVGGFGAVVGSMEAKTSDMLVAQLFGFAGLAVFGMLFWLMLRAHRK